MSSEDTRSSPSPRERRDHLDQVIAEFLGEVEAGRSPSRERYLARYPELADDLSSFFENRDRLRAVVGSDATHAAPGPDSTADGRPLRDPVWTSEVLPSPGRDRGSDSDSDSFDHGRFVPGTLLSDRYRIVGRLGEGGMGEVYRADDLELGQSVALKFLPQSVTRDPKSLARLRNEVRLARQISHPNVCRVYDIGRVDELCFLSMEYIDGEDLASLLRRIGRFPADRAVEVARQLCAGLGAAHSRGVLHRDLKPANVMVDGRGKVLITDFGLAIFGDRVPEGEIRVGTPAYMAPEQLDGQQVSVESDLYGLGLVLYEVFTGKSAFEADSLAQLIEVRRESTPELPSSVIETIDPAIERVILQCLEPDPRSRPASAMEVASRLPGGDPLAAAIAAGETPSPELIARSGAVGGLEATTAWGLFASVLVGVALTAVLCGHVQLVGLAPLELKPEQLELKASELLEELGYAGSPFRAYGFEYDTEYLRFLRESPTNDIGTGPVAGIFFWYRSSAEPLVPRASLEDPDSFVFARGLATERDPPLEPGMVSVRLDLAGRLISFRVASPRLGVVAPGASVERRSGETDWAPLFAAAGLSPDLTRYDDIEPSLTPPVGCDARRAWVSSSEPEGGRRIVEAASLDGRPVFFQVVSPWNLPGGDAAGVNVFMSILAVSYGVLVSFAVFLALRNWRLGRGDRRGAFRLAAFFFVASMLAWFFQASHVGSYHELFLVILGLERALLWAAQIWLFYLALEPYVRRLWPQTLVSWSRLLSGRVRDPMIGRDLLIGALAGVSFELLEKLGEFASLELSGEPPIPHGPLFGSWGTWLNSLLGERYAIGELLTFQLHAVSESLFYCLLFFLFLRTVVRRQWLAALLYIASHTALLAAFKLTLGHHAVIVFFCAAGVTIVLWLLLRHGLLAVVGCHVVMHLFDLPISVDFSKWYSGSGLVGLATVVAIALFGVVTSQVGQPRSLVRAS